MISEDFRNLIRSEWIRSNLSVNDVARKRCISRDRALQMCYGNIQSRKLAWDFIDFLKNNKKEKLTEARNAL